MVYVLGVTVQVGVSVFGVVVAEGVTVAPKQMGDISATVTLGFAGMVTV